MEKEVKQDILKVLVKGLNAVKKNDIVVLRDLSNMTIHNASVVQDADSATIAILFYSLSKIFERSDYKEHKGWNLFYNTVVNSLESAEKELRGDNIVEYEYDIKLIFQIVSKLDDRLREYIKKVFESAKIHKASRLHEHGISVGRTAKLLGLSEWELMDYIGKTGIADVYTETITVKNRLKLARGLFK